MSCAKLKLTLLIPLIVLMACSAPVSQATDVEKAADKAVVKAKAELFEALANYTLGDTITTEITESIDAAVVKLEQAAGEPPKLTDMTEILTGQWASLFSSQTWGNHGGGDSRLTTQMALQELNLEKSFYRNMKIMNAGEIPLLHISTAELSLAKDVPNVFELWFNHVEFVPARADVDLKELRSVLGLSEDAKLAVYMPSDAQTKSRSTVTFVDKDLRINRGKDSLEVLRKITAAER